MEHQKVGSSLYKSFIMDNVKEPKNSGLLVDFTHESDVANASCGDEVHLRLNIVDGVIEEIGYDVHGCAISLASMSILSEKIKGMSVEELKEIDDKFMFDMMGIEPSTGRSKCVLISRDALLSALDV